MRNSLLQTAEDLDGSGRRFVQDRYQRGTGDPNQGFGITAVLEDGALLEKVSLLCTWTF